MSCPNPAGDCHSCILGFLAGHSQDLVAETVEDACGQCGCEVVLIGGGPDRCLGCEAA